MGSSPTEAGGAPAAMTGWVTLGNGEVRELASLGSRLGARVLDWILVSVVIGILAVIGIVGAIATGDEVGLIALVFGLALAVLFVTLLYEMTMIAVLGQTVGKMMVGAKVVRATEGDVPGWGKSVGRWLILVAPSLIPIGGFLLTLLVYLSPTFDDRRQGWHDKAVATVVVRA